MQSCHQELDHDCNIKLTPTFCSCCLCITAAMAVLQLLHHVVECGVDGATVNWPQQAADALGSTPAVKQRLAHRGLLK
jgi:hypothetical protein